MNNIPYIITMVAPVFAFLITSLYVEKRKDKTPIYWGLGVAVLVGFLLYIFLPLIVVVGS